MSCPIKYGGKLFMAVGEQIVLSKFIGGLFYMEGYGLGHGKSRGVLQMHFPLM